MSFWHETLSDLKSMIDRGYHTRDGRHGKEVIEQEFNKVKLFSEDEYSQIMIDIKEGREALMRFMDIIQHTIPSLLSQKQRQDRFERIAEWVRSAHEDAELARKKFKRVTKEVISLE